MKTLLHRTRRYRPGDRVIYRPTDRPGLVVDVLADGRHLVAVAAPGAGRVARGILVSPRELRPDVDLAA